MEWISSKRPRFDIYSSSLISIGFNNFHVVARYSQNQDQFFKEKLGLRFGLRIFNFG